ncbi:exlusion protein FxsA [Actinopolyspora erythraea]|uniref:Exlusion protein FxsA n=1 Tax=Actinopolyspora erythraea TaxID=414996 RepID=A0A099D3N7_9ACTN|nr:FxsA family protein [Actinopolyspora erythraea]ASU79222.1 exlusion protein FxsA [Actinopolyspora erythraea]KGI80803.1 exlusion protein FxsA [Actinopolyspora erythraea]
MPILILLLVGVAVEISVLVLVGQLIGVFPTIGLLLAGALVGSWLLRREGRRTLREFGEAARTRRPPEREISDGVLIGGGGLLIMVPGLLSDVVGLLVLLPPVRALLRTRMRRSAERQQQRMREHMVGFGPAGFGPDTFAAPGFGAARSGRRGRDDEDVIDGEVVSVSEDDEGEPPEHDSRPLDQGGTEGPDERGQDRRRP